MLSRYSAPVNGLVRPVSRLMMAVLPTPWQSRVERLPHVVHLPLCLVDRRPWATKFALEQCINWPLVVPNQRQALTNRSVASSKLHVRALIAFAILDVQVRDPIVVLLQERHGVVATGSEVPDVEVDHEGLRPREHPFPDFPSGLLDLRTQG